VERALENAAVKAGMRRHDLVKVMVTGGASLSPWVRGLLTEMFGIKVEYARPFDAVVLGACRGEVTPILQHDYAIESYNRERQAYEFKALFAIGAEYPTPRDMVKFWAKGSYDGMTRIGLKIFEVSRVARQQLDASLVDAEGRLRGVSRVASAYEHVCLNAENPTFIEADPPINLQRDARRFLTAFWVDGNRRLVVTVVDNLTGKTLLQDYPVVRL